MTILVVLVLCGVWAAYLLPPMLRGRGMGSRKVGAGHGLAAIGSAASRILSESADSELAPRASESPAARSGAVNDGIDSFMPDSAVAARHRRMTVLGVLGTLALVTLVAVPVFGPAALLLNLGFDALLVAMAYFTYQRSAKPRQAPVVRSLDFHRQVHTQRNELSGAVQLPENELARRLAN